ncbi:hypothetical protein ACOKFD_00095 [Flagellimonas sp. S174]|uniref:hypothetical protein n=1 Tax=Flagellimonas sp. S174 TaxID=3410790 RepID=UPI003BF5F59D
MTTSKFTLLFVSITCLLFSSSCSKDEETMSCEANNTGTLIIENSRSTGILKIFFDQEPRSGNIPGDLNISPGETANSDLLAGQRIIYALLDTSTCNEGTCIVRNQTLPERTIDLMTCQEFNIAY